VAHSSTQGSIPEQPVGAHPPHQPQRGSNERRKSETQRPDFSQHSLTDPCCSATYTANRYSLSGRSGDELFAIGAICTHYGALQARRGRYGPMPMASACFSLPTGEALRAPALDPVSRWQVRRGARPSASAHASRDARRHRYVREKLESVGRQPWPIPSRGPSLSSVARQAQPRKRFVTSATPLLRPHR
jgi:nitrite reductase/ring-hydroxylating ferredoxin subunit